jgi:hypothetical protein
MAQFIAAEKFDRECLNRDMQEISLVWIDPIVF